MSYFDGEVVLEQCHQDPWGYYGRLTEWVAGLAVGGAIR